MFFSCVHVQVTSSSLAIEETQILNWVTCTVQCKSSLILFFPFVFIFELLASFFSPLNLQDLSKSPKSVKKLLPKRKPERKQSEEEFALRKSKFMFSPAKI